MRLNSVLNSGRITSFENVGLGSLNIFEIQPGINNKIDSDKKSLKNKFIAKSIKSKTWFV